MVRQIEAENGEIILAAYCRVSTTMQCERGDSLDVQEQRLRAAAAQRGCSVVVYREEGISAKDANRPAYQAMMRDLEARAVHGILATKLDRLWRNLPLAVTEVQRITVLLRADLIILDQQFDTTTAAGRAMLNMLLSFGQFERDITVERVRETMQARARQGRFNGGPVPYGYRLVARGQLEIDEAEAEVVREMFRLAGTFGSVRQTCHRLNHTGCRTRVGKHWAMPTVQRLLRSKLYTGHLVYNRRDVSTGKARHRPAAEHIEAVGAVPAIISEELFATVQERLQTRTTLAPRSQAARYLLSGLLRCGLCGGKLYGQDARGGRHGSGRYYRCWQRMQKGTAACAGVSVRTDVLEAVIVESLFDLRVDKGALHKLAEEQAVRRVSELQPLRAAVSRLEKELAALDRREDSVLRAFEDGTYSASDLKTRRATIDRERTDTAAALQQAQEAVNATEGEAIDVERAVALLESGFDVFQHLDFERQREFIRAVVSDIFVNPMGGRFVFRVPTEKGFEALEAELGGRGEGPRDFVLEGSEATEWMTVGAIRVPRRIGDRVYRLASEVVEEEAQAAAAAASEGKPAETSKVYDRGHTGTGSWQPRA